MITVLRAKPELFRKDIVQGVDFWHVYNSIPKSEKEDINNMKFKAIVGNPPYQLSDGGGSKGISASPIYHTFVNNAKSVHPCYVSMIMPARWYAGGKGLDDFRHDMLTDRHVSVLTDFPKSRDCFTSSDIAGGVCFFLWDENYQGDCRFTSSIGSDSTTCIRNLSEFDIFIRDNIGIGIIHKVLAKMNRFYSSRIFQYKPFGLRTYVRGESLPFNGAIIIHSSQGQGYIKEDEVTKNKELINDYKIYIGLLDPDRAGVNNSSSGRNVITKVKLIGPKEVITESYILLDSLKKESDAIKAAKFFAYPVYRREDFPRDDLGVRGNCLNFLILADTFLRHLRECEWQQALPNTKPHRARSLFPLLSQSAGCRAKPLPLRDCAI